MVVDAALKVERATLAQECTLRSGEVRVMATACQLQGNQATGVEPDFCQALGEVHGSARRCRERHEAWVAQAPLGRIRRHRDVGKSVQPRWIHGEAIRVEDEHMGGAHLDMRQRSIECSGVVVPEDRKLLVIHRKGEDLSHPGKGLEVGCAPAILVDHDDLSHAAIGMAINLGQAMANPEWIPEVTGHQGVVVCSTHRTSPTRRTHGC